MNAGVYNLEFSYAAKNEAWKICCISKQKFCLSLLICQKQGMGNGELRNINLNKGENKLRLLVEQGGFDFKSIQFVKAK